MMQIKNNVNIIKNPYPLKATNIPMLLLFDDIATDWRYTQLLVILFHKSS